MTKVVDVAALTLEQLEKIADQLEAAGRQADLAAVLKQLAVLRPKSSSVHLKLGRTLIAIGDGAGAEEALQKYIALQKEPASAVHGLLGTALVAQQKYVQALEPLYLAVTRDKTDLLAQKGLAVALCHAGKHEQGLRKFAQLRRTSPKDAEIPYLQALSLLQHGMYAEAAEAARASIDLGGGSPFHYCALGNAYANSGDIEAAYTAYRNAWADEFDSPVSHEHWLSDLVRTLGFGDAVAWLEKRARDSSDPALSYHLAKLAFKDGRIPDASEALAVADTQLPGSIMVADLRTRIAAAQGKWQAASTAAAFLWDKVARGYRGGVAPMPGPRPLPAAQILHKLIYSSVEIVGREFDSRLLMACQAAKRGLTTVLASSHVLASSESLPPGVFLLKTMNAYDKKRILSLAHTQHRFAALDEEALGMMGDDEVQVCEMDPQIVNLVDVVMANSERHRTALLRIFPALKDKVYATGNARIELVNPRAVQSFEVEAQGLRTRFGSTILICTNFGTMLSAHHDYFQICNIVLEATNRPPGTPQAESIIKMGKEAALAESRGMAVLIEFIPKLAAAYPDITFVIRPHPVENPATWKTVFASLNNVIVSSEGSLQAWLKAAKAMIYFAGCMTGLEAYLGKVQAIRFDVGQELVYPGYGISAHINPGASTSGELIARIGQALSGELAQYQDAQADAEVVADQILVEGELPSARTANVLAAYFDSLEALPVGEAEFQMIKSVVAAQSSRLEVKMATGQLFDAKRIKASLSDVLSRLKDFRRLYDDFQDVGIVELATGAFLIEPTGATGAR